jgi:hypothetical protein
MDVAAGMYHTGLDRFTSKELHVAKQLRDGRHQQALLQFFEPKNYFEVRQSARLRQRPLP